MARVFSARDRRFGGYLEGYEPRLKSGRGEALQLRPLRAVALPAGGGLMAGPLAGLRVVELATVVAGPGTGKYLADFGAEVVKVEAPGGDPTRRMGWTGSGE